MNNYCKLLLLLILSISLQTLANSQEEFNEFNYEEKNVPDYTLPEILRLSDGSMVSNPSDWTERREEILTLFKQEVYGDMPPHEIAIEYSSIQEKRNALGGKAILKEIAMTFSGQNKSRTSHILIYLPKESAAPLPIFLGVNFYGNHTIHPDKSITITESWVRNNADFGISENRASETSRGARQSRWAVEEILERGYGLAVIYYGDIDPDFDDGFKNGVHELMDPASNMEDWSSIGAWAYGLSSVMDYFETDSEIDETKVAVFGHSRLGKTSLWAGALDERFAMVISNDSGCGGAALSRRHFGETIQRINTNFPHWFCANFKQYNEQENALPVDQHMLLSLVAPRPLYVASASEDLWADPRGEYLSLYHAGEAYRLFDPETKLSSTSPGVDTPVHSGKLGYHLRTGKHDVTDYDWERFMDFADVHLKK